ncbi:MAG: ABC transporter substrate-binding protein [Rickettsiales bacterium]|jgi:putative ABC transport system substrate-binding protein|nr:ABC transporter substrate-binding protein [Rickettsiales bacterium]
MRKIIVLIIGITLSFLAYSDVSQYPTYEQEEDKPLLRVDIIQTIAHPALDNTYRGIIDQLTEEGFVAKKNTEIRFANAQGDVGLSNQIAKKFASGEPDALVAIPTQAAQSAVNATRNTKIPVVFSSVTDPVNAGLVKDLSETNTNVTGVSNFINLDEQLALFKQILPDLKKLGFIYNPGEVNSVIILKSLEEIANKYDIEIVTSVAAKTTEVAGATNKLIGKVDAIFISNDNTALSAFRVISKIALTAKTPVFVSDTDMVKRGALASLGPNQYEIGRQTGKILAQILRGKDVKDLPVEFPKQIELVINQDIAQELGITFSKEILDRASK